MSGTVAVDIGTSGIRAQAIDGDGRPIRTCITSHNPVPGANVMDHMSFAIGYGEDLAHRLITGTVRELCNRLGVPSPDRVAVCGNPIQLSFFENIGIKDLAYAGENKLRSENVAPLERRGHIADGEDLGLPGQEVVIPPAVRHEIGADALAMMLKSGFLDDDMCMVTDFGTNAEMALKVGDRIFTGSAAAGPAMEGQQISCGMLASPGALSDLERTPSGWQSKVLGPMLEQHDGPVINLRSSIVARGGTAPKGITGTGVVALVHACMEDGIFDDGRFGGGTLQISRGVSFTEKDFREAGKAIGAIRAGHMTLMLEAGVDPVDVRTMYMAGASGTYVDPYKAKRTGMVIPDCTRVKQVGNTSLALARDLARDPGMLDGLNALKDRLTARHVMFASSDTFSDLYLYEFGYWNDGMPLARYRRALERYGLEGYLDRCLDITVERTCTNDIGDLGDSFEIIGAGTSMGAVWDCRRCGVCVSGCPEKALSCDDGGFSVDTGRCLGTACQRCVENCPDHVFDYSAFSLRGRCPGSARPIERVISAMPHPGRGMPELPEIETVRRAVGPLLTGRTIVSADILREKIVTCSPAELSEHVRGRRVTGVSRRAKVLLISLDDGSMVTVRFGMTGTLVVTGSDAAEHRHARAVFFLDDGGRAEYRDMRMFGHIRYVPPGGPDHLDGIGMEPTDPRLTGGFLEGNMGGSRRCIKTALLDQGTVCGLGNIYSDEVLWRSRICPEARCCDLSQNQWDELAHHIPEVISDAVEGNSVTAEEFMEDGGTRYRYRTFDAYGRSGRPCPRCGTAMVRSVIGNRSSVWCPVCQRPHPSPDPQGPQT